MRNRKLPLPASVGRCAPCLAAALLLLCSCSAGRPAAGASPEPTATPARGEAAQAVDAADPLWNGDPFALAVPCEITVRGSGNQYGFYQVVVNADGSRNATFIDYETRQQIYLCADANCQHDAEQCASWFPADSGEIWPIACDSQLYFVHNSWQATSYIEKANLDGSGRQKLCELEEGETFDSGAAYKPGYLVLMIDSVTLQQDAAHTERLVAFDTETGEATCLYENLPPQSRTTNAFFQGVTSHGFIVETIGAEETGAVQRHTVYEIPFDGSGMHAIASFQNGEMQGTPDGDDWFYLRSGADGRQLQLGAIDSETGEDKILVADLETTIPVTSLGDVFIRSFVDDWIIINAMTSADFDENRNIELLYNCYAVNRQTLEIRELHLSNYYHATRVPIEIYAQFEDKLLVEAKIEEVAPQNGEQGMTGLERTLGILRKADYLNSNADALQPIQFAF